MDDALIIAGLWVAFALSWIAAMAWRSAAVQQVDFRQAIGYRAAMIIGGVVLGIPAHHYDGVLRLWYPTRDMFFVVVALIVLGFAFAWWARIWLGALWSGSVTKKADHHVVDTGPYSIVRHPIYTGILLAVFATAAIKGTVLGLAGAAIVTLGIWMKARLEERFLRDALGPADCDAYRARVPMLMPFWPR